MSFTVHDYRDLVRLLKMRPEWKKELRQLLLPDELLALPEIVQQLSLAQQHTEEQLLRLEATVQRLVEQVAVLLEGQDRILKRVGSLEDGQKHIIKRVASLEEGQKRLEEGQRELKDDVGELKKGQKELKDDVGKLKGDMLENRYRNRICTILGTRLRLPKITKLYMLLDTLEEKLTPDEIKDLFDIDLVVDGKPRHIPDSPKLFVSIEISYVIDRNDVSRAVRRASLLRKAGLHSVPVVAGKKITQGARQAVCEQNVAFMLDGHVELWEEAVANWVAIHL